MSGGRTKGLPLLVVLVMVGMLLPTPGITATADSGVRPDKTSQDE
jgi:hypothetical protein